MVKNQNVKKSFSPLELIRSGKGIWSRNSWYNGICILHCHLFPSATRAGESAVWVLMPVPNPCWCWLANANTVTKKMFVWDIYLYYYRRSYIMRPSCNWSWVSHGKESSPASYKQMQTLQRKTPYTTEFLPIARWVKCCSRGQFLFYHSLGFFIFFYSSSVILLRSALSEHN